MKITVDEMVDMCNRTQDAIDKAYVKGKRDKQDEFAEERAKEPKTLFASLIKYAEKENVLIDYHYSSGKTDGCNWVQIEPTREGKEGTKHVEISFGDDLNSIYHIGIGAVDDSV